jgi:hypothetical protein
MAPNRRGGQECPAASPAAGAGSPSEADPGSGPDPAQTLRGDAEAESFRAGLERARRLVALELDLAESRRRVVEDSLKITEAQLELAEQEIEELKAENERLRWEIAGLRGG